MALRLPRKENTGVRFLLPALMKTDKLMVVAHPDDESLFGGAQLLTSNGWKVVCVTNGDNLVRRAEFESVMASTNCQYEIWSYYDQITTPLDSAVFEDLRRVVCENNWSKIVTHGATGEYGHLHHIQIHDMMQKLVSNLWTFDFFGSPLPDVVWQKKLDLIEVYKSQEIQCFIPSIRNEKITRNISCL